MSGQDCAGIGDGACGFVPSPLWVPTSAGLPEVRSCVCPAGHHGCPGCDACLGHILNPLDGSTITLRPGQPSLCGYCLAPLVGDRNAVGVAYLREVTDAERRMLLGDPSYAHALDHAVHALHSGAMTHVHRPPGGAR